VDVVTSEEHVPMPTVNLLDDADPKAALCEPVTCAGILNVWGDVLHLVESPAPPTILAARDSVLKVSTPLDIYAQFGPVPLLLLINVLISAKTSLAAVLS